MTPSIAKQITNMTERHICAKFGIDASLDFRFIRGANHGTEQHSMVEHQNTSFHT